MDLTKNVGSLKERDRRFLFIVLSFAIPFTVMVLGLIALHAAPFGKHNLAISDGMGYVYGLVGHGRFLKSLIKGDINILYSLGGLGVNSWASSAWGDYTPVKLLTLFITMETAPDWLSWISVVGLSICGLTMYLLLVYLRGNKLSNLIFSTSYALVGFNVANCYQILFFIGPQLLPLMVLGLIKMLRGKSPLTYILSLCSCIFFNFYFGYHLCVASVIFFLGYLYIHNDELIGIRRKIFGTWLGASVIAGLIPAFFWLPALKAFSGGGRLNDTSISQFQIQENMPFVQIFSKLFTGAYSISEMQNGLPNIFCGILVVALVVLFFINKRILVKKKKTAAVIIGFYLLTFYITAFTLLMHGGTHTNWFPYRYSYVFSFILIIIASIEFEYLDTITLKDAKKVGVGLLIAVLIIFSTRYEFITGGSVLFDFTLLLLMWLGFYAYKTSTEKAPKNLLALFLLILVCINLYANYALSIYKIRDWELDINEYHENLLKNGALIEAIKATDTSFYRMEKEDPDLGNLSADPGLYGYYGVSASGPTIRSFVNSEPCKIGLNWWNARHWYSEGIPEATDALLGLKYILSERDLAEEKGYEKMAEIDGMGLYQNPNALPISILIDSEAGKLELGENLFDNLNNIWKSMTGESENIFNEQHDITYALKNNITEQSITNKELQISVSKAQAGEASEYNDSCCMEYTFAADYDGPLYVFDTSVPLSADGLTIPAVRYIDYCHKGDTVNGILTISNGYVNSELFRGYCANQVFSYADEVVLDKYVQLLNSRNITFNKEKDSHLSGTFSADKDQRILFTTVWDEGWTCYIDGEKVPIDKTWNLFMSVEVPEGEHTWEMIFFPAWMDYGIYISISSLVALVIFMAIWKKKVKKSFDISLNEENYTVENIEEPLNVIVDNKKDYVTEADEGMNL